MYVPWFNGNVSESTAGRDGQSVLFRDPPGFVKDGAAATDSKEEATWGGT